MRPLEDLLETQDPAIARIRDWVDAAEVRCELLPPSADRAEVLLGLQVTTRSTLGALAYDTGGVLVDEGWLRFLGSGHPRFTRTLTGWNAGRAEGFHLVADDAAGGFFALNGGALGPDLKAVYYWPPDSLEWECLDLGLTDLIGSFVTDRIATFYEGLRWPSWRSDVRTLPADKCFAFYPPLWTKEGSVEGSHRAPVPVNEAFDLKREMVGKLGGSP